MRFNIVSVKTGISGDYGFQLFQFEDSAEEWALLGLTWSDEAFFVDVFWTNFVFWRGV
jgi:hypothetical protein